jgi:hypothetical protein
MSGRRSRRRLCVFRGTGRARGDGEGDSESGTKADFAEELLFRIHDIGFTFWAEFSIEGWVSDAAGSRSRGARRQ